MSVDINAIAKQFVDFYYATFASDRKNLHSLYVCPSNQLMLSSKSDASFQRHHSMLTFEGSPIQGAEAIVEKLTVLLISQRLIVETSNSLSLSVASISESTTQSYNSRRPTLINDHCQSPCLCYRNAAGKLY